MYKVLIQSCDIFIEDPSQIQVAVLFYSDKETFVKTYEFAADLGAEAILKQIQGLLDSYNLSADVADSLLGDIHTNLTAKPSLSMDVIISEVPELVKVEEPEIEPKLVPQQV